MAETPDCPYCENPAKLVDSKEIYPHRKDLAAQKYYLCRPCNAYVRCHQDTERPLGSLANPELRAARTKAHQVFDAWWENNKITRTQAYHLLAKQLDINDNECHIGMFDLKKCLKTIETYGEGLF